MSKLEQLMSAALREMREAQRFAATQTDEGYEISLQHVKNADSYIKQINQELLLSNEQAEPDLPTA